MPVTYSTLTLTPDHAVPVQPAGGNAIVTVTSGSTVYYGSDSQVNQNRNDGSIANGSSASFIKPAWLSTAQGGRSTVTITFDTTSIVVGGGGALSTAATDGFLYIPYCAGTPTGTPTAHPGGVPIIFDTTANKLWAYSGGAWKGVAVT
jgi:hypothetical protein